MEYILPPVKNKPFLSKQNSFSLHNACVNIFSLAEAYVSRINILSASFNEEMKSPNNARVRENVWGWNNTTMFLRNL